MKNQQASNCNNEIQKKNETITKLKQNNNDQ